ncbi:PAS domain-containing sensor histidine kinase, partial [filamentous cyanobacterium CCP5]
VGFNPKDLPHIFDRFYRADPARQRTGQTTQGANKAGEVGGGTGLGLSIVQQILQVHQGTIKAENHPDLGGGWLQIYLPECLLV